MSHPDAWTAVRGRPWRFLASAWPWRSLAYVVATVPIGLAGCSSCSVTLAIGVATVVVVVGLLVLAGVPLLARLIAAAERARARVGPAARDRHRGCRCASSSGRRGLPRRLAGDRASRSCWRPCSGSSTPWCWCFVVTAAGGARCSRRVLVRHDTRRDRSGGRSTPPARPGPRSRAGLRDAGRGWRTPSPVLACGQAALTRLLLDPPEHRLAAAVAELRRSRTGLVDAFETERRRIERDLHDGVQQRLVALTMTLGSAELDVPDGAGPRPASARRTGRPRRPSRTSAPRCGASTPGCWPTTAWPRRCTRSPTAHRSRSTSSSRAGDGRLPEAVEAAAYFVVSEALTNVARHAACASRAGARAGSRTIGWCSRSSTTAVGGADPSRGSGLAGLAPRVEALDGDLAHHQPAGRPDGGADGVPARRDAAADRARRGRGPAP